MTALSAFAGSKGYAVYADAVFPPFLRKQKGGPAERRSCPLHRCKARTVLLLVFFPGTVKKLLTFHDIVI